MDFMLNLDLKKWPKQIGYHDRILLIGSCFTEHMGDSLSELKFSVLQNPNGILYDPLGVSKSLQSYIQNKQFSESDLFHLNGLWQSWQHHSRFSGINKDEVLEKINQSQHNAHEFLKEADWLIITFGTAYSYHLIPEVSESAKASPSGGGLSTASSVVGAVANCHRAPAAWFNKYLLNTDEIIYALGNSIDQLFNFNRKLNIIFTVSPVRHIRDGIVENNHSKARLIESVHHLVSKFDRLFYFPAYELVIDVLRDYRFYDSDMVHPNKIATQFVFERFAEICINDDSKVLMQDIRNIIMARKHKPFQPLTEPHKKFMLSHYEKAKQLNQKFPNLDLQNELNYFSGNSDTL